MPVFVLNAQKRALFLCKLSKKIYKNLLKKFIIYCIIYINGDFGIISIADRVKATLGRERNDE